MARPRKFPDLEDRPPTIAPDGGLSYEPTGADFVTLTPRTAKALRKQAKTMLIPAPAGYYDPLSVMCVTDCLLRLANNTTVRGRDLSMLLNVEYPQLLWKPVVVGRILSDLVEAAQAFDPDFPPIEKFQSYGGLRFAIATTGRSWKWLVAVRLLMGKVAERDVTELRAQGVPPSHTSLPWDLLAEIDVDAELEE